MPVTTSVTLRWPQTVNASGPTWDEPDITFRAKSSAAIVDETIRFITAHKDKPFYVNAWMLIPHAPLNPPEEQMKPYASLNPVNKNFPFKSAAQIFYGSVTDMDKQIGRLTDGLKALGIDDKTLVIFTSDNGPYPHLPGRTVEFRGCKFSLYEGGGINNTL